MQFFPRFPLRSRKLLWEQRPKGPGLGINVSPTTRHQCVCAFPFEMSTKGAKPGVVFSRPQKWFGVRAQGLPHRRTKTVNQLGNREGGGSHRFIRDISNPSSLVCASVRVMVTRRNLLEVVVSPSSIVFPEKPSERPRTMFRESIPTR
jgi:hypothetical protein